MTVAIRIAGIAHTPLATHQRVASPHDSPSAVGGGPTAVVPGSARALFGRTWLGSDPIIRF